MSTHTTKNGNTTVTWNEMAASGPIISTSVPAVSAVATPRSIVTVTAGIRTIQDESGTYVIHPSG